MRCGRGESRGSRRERWKGRERGREGGGDEAETAVGVGAGALWLQGFTV
jgi:hypothetical protein